MNQSKISCAPDQLLHWFLTINEVKVAYVSLIMSEWLIIARANRIFEKRKDNAWDMTAEGWRRPRRTEPCRGFHSTLFPSLSTFDGCVTRWHKTARHYVAVVRVRMTGVSVSIHLAAGYVALHKTFPVGGEPRDDSMKMHADKM